MTSGKGMIIMARNVAIGIQNFEEIIKGNCFYIDKTNFIKEWWDSKDSVTLITRPRRFGKTLNMSMIEQFFSANYAERGDLFERFSIWEYEEYRQIQGTYPVISLSFANIKEDSFSTTKEKICRLIQTLFMDCEYLLDSEALSSDEKEIMIRMKKGMNDAEATLALHYLSKFLNKHHGKKAIILLDEYDTPMQEAYVNGYWDELVSFTRSLFNSTFKTNPYLERGLMTGITRVSKESIFSDLNNLKVVTTTSEEYATSFGFTEEEVFAALDECGLGDHKNGVKAWYDGFIFGKHSDIYNPWSVLNFLDTNGAYDTYWANTSGNRLVGKLLQEGNKRIKLSFEALLNGEMISSPIEEQIVYNQLGRKMSDDLTLGSDMDGFFYYPKKSAVINGKKYDMVYVFRGNILENILTDAGFTETKVVLHQLNKGGYLKTKGGRNNAHPYTVNASTLYLYGYFCVVFFL